MHQVAQWTASAVDKGLAPQDNQLASAYSKFMVSAMQMGRQAVKDIRVAAAVSALAAKHGISQADLTVGFAPSAGGGASGACPAW